MAHCQNYHCANMGFYVMLIAILSVWSVFFELCCRRRSNLAPLLNSIMGSLIVLLFIIRLACVIFVVFIRLKVNATRDIHAEKKNTYEKT